MPISFFAATNIGRIRSVNQDAYLGSGELNLYIVADGMGGQAAGEVASSEAVSAIVDHFKETRKSANQEKVLRQAVIKANDRVFSLGCENPEKRGMGTTVVAALIQENKLHVANVGDSRAYLYREAKLDQITSDHSLMNQQLQAGIIDESQLKQFPFPNIITRAVGSDSKVEVDIFQKELKHGDMILLCSDGLTSMVPDYDIAYILMLGENDLEITTDALVFRANDKGGNDNITVLLIRYQEDEQASE